MRVYAHVLLFFVYDRYVDVRNVSIRNACCHFLCMMSTRMYVLILRTLGIRGCTYCKNYMERVLSFLCIIGTRMYVLTLGTLLVLILRTLGLRGCTYCKKYMERVLSFLVYDRYADVRTHTMYSIRYKGMAAIMVWFCCVSFRYLARLWMAF